MKGEDYPCNPIMQVLESYKVVIQNPKDERYRLLLSDGKYTSWAVWVALTSNDVPPNLSVVKIDKFKTTFITDEQR